jgi:nicotinic acid phosphoribosyltransferase
LTWKNSVNFGIGTHFTNNCGVEPLQIVIKLAKVNGQEVIKISNYVIEIPQFATKHSLKNSVCTRVVLWELIC